MIVTHPKHSQSASTQTFIVNADSPPANSPLTTFPQWPYHLFITQSPLVIILLVLLIILFYHTTFLLFIISINTIYSIYTPLT
jgi:hypothetical protein